MKNFYAYKDYNKQKYFYIQFEYIKIHFLTIGFHMYLSIYELKNI